MNNLLNLFECYTSPFGKIRMGTKNGDGGYVIADSETLSYNAFVSAGISTNSDFKEEILLKFPSLEQHCFIKIYE
jgi:hypothetical protein